MRFRPRKSGGAAGATRPPGRVVGSGGAWDAAGRVLAVSGALRPRCCGSRSGRGFGDGGSGRILGRIAEAKPAETFPAPSRAGWVGRFGRRRAGRLGVGRLEGALVRKGDKAERELEAAGQDGVQPSLARFGGFSSGRGLLVQSRGRCGWLQLGMLAGGSRRGALIRRAGKPPEQPPKGGFDEKVQRQHQGVGHPFRARDKAPGEERVGDGLRRAFDESFMFHGRETNGLSYRLQDLFCGRTKFFARGGHDGLTERGRPARTPTCPAPAPPQEGGDRLLPLPCGLVGRVGVGWVRAWRGVGGFRRSRRLGCATRPWPEDAACGNLRGSARRRGWRLGRAGFRRHARRRRSR